jgi:hypothetical protein
LATTEAAKTTRTSSSHREDTSPLTRIAANLRHGPRLSFSTAMGHTTRASTKTPFPTRTPRFISGDRQTPNRISDGSPTTTTLRLLKKCC